MKSAMLLYLGQPRVALAETRAVALAAAEAPTDRSVEAEALVLEGQIHESLGDLRESERVLWRAGAAAEECGHDDIAGQTWIILAGVLAMRYRHAEADRCVDMAAGVIARLGGNKRFDASLALALSRLAQHRGRLGEAQAQAERSQRLLEQIGAIGPIVAEARLRVALVLHDQGKLAAGLGHTEEGLAIMRAFVGPEHPHLAPYWLHLARSLTALGRYDEALDASRRAVDLGRKAQDDNRLLMAESLSVWGDVLVARGRNDEALAAHLEALNLFVLVVGADDPTTALARIGHGQALRAALRLEEALAEQRAAVAVLERVADQRDPQLGSALHELGVTLATQKEPAEALPLLERALALRTKVGVGPAEVAATRFAVAQALVGMRQEHQRARELALLARAEYARAEGRHAATLGEIDRWLAGRSSR